MIWWSYFHIEKKYWNQIEILQPKNGFGVYLTVCQRGSNVVSFFEWDDKLHHFLLPIEVPFKEIWNSTPTRLVQAYMFWHLWFKREGHNKNILVNTTYLVKFLEAQFDLFSIKFQVAYQNIFQSTHICNDFVQVGDVFTQSPWSTAVGRHSYVTAFEIWFQLNTEILS